MSDAAEALARLEQVAYSADEDVAIVSVADLRAACAALRTRLETEEVERLPRSVVPPMLTSMQDVVSRMLKEDLKVVTRVDEHGKGLNDWEKIFVERCLYRLKGEKQALTPAQREIIGRLDEEKVE